MHQRVVGVLGLMLFAAGCGSPSVAVHVTPPRSNEDQPVHIVVDGLGAHKRVSLQLRSTDSRGVAFTSNATFVADAHGVVDVDRARAGLGSSYSGVWPMGLLTSMSAPNAPPFTYYWWSGAPRRFTVTISAAGKTIASTSFSRGAPADWTVTGETVSRDGFDGFYYAPKAAARRPAVLLFGGSEGGVGESLLASTLASHGVPTLAIAYFHAPGLPNDLKNIPLEYFRRALLWLDRQPQVEPSRVSVYGVSRGSEAALLLGVHYPALVHGVVALVPNDASACGIAGAGRDSGCIGPAWTIGGKPIPYTKLINNPHPWDNPKAVIPVEQIRAPILLACGGVDQVWSSCPYSAAIVARLKAHGKGEQVALYRYPTAGHYIGEDVVFEPGSLAGDFYVPQDERAREQLWPHVLAFLEQN